MKKVIVISGVTSGVGKEIASKFVGLDWNVIGLARNESKLQELSQNLGENFIFLATDIRNEENVTSAFKYIKTNFNKIDIIVNNAAIFKMDEFINCSFNDINLMIDTNLKGAMYSTLKAIEIMKQSSSSGRIINIASVAATHGIENQAIYCASKFGLNGFSEALNQEVIKDNISITTLFPGGIDTPLWSENNPYPAGSTENLLKANDIVNIIEMLSDLEPRIILKNMTIFPSNEWH